MSRCVWLMGSLLCIGLFAGCRCCPCFETYAGVIDDIGDVDLVSDRWYNPRFDISRAGRPDWCGPINRRICPCLCFQGCWDRYDECWLYPPSHPYLYPASNLYATGHTVPVPALVAPPDSTETPEALPPAPEQPTLEPAPVPALPDAKSPPRPTLTTQEGWRPRRTAVQ